MKLVNGQPYLHYRDLVNAGCFKDEGSLREARSRKRKSMRFIDDPDDNRVALVEYETLPEKHKEAVLAHFGNPYEHLTFEPIRSLVTKDVKAEQFYLGYKLGNGNTLPIDAVRKYTRAAEFMNMLLLVESNKALAKSITKSMALFYANAIEIISKDGIALPGTYRRLLPKIKQYKESGYECLVDAWRYNNSFAAKVNDDVSASTLLEMIADERGFDDTQVMRAYNKFADENGYKQITDATVGVWRREHEQQIMMYREGRAKFYDKYGKVLLGKRPSAPLLLIENDGNDWDMYFQNERINKTSVQTYHFNTFNIVVVIDTFNNYILGWAMGLQETKNLIWLALIDAMYNIKMLTGNYYLPHQIKNDRFGEKGLRHIYEAIDDSYFKTAARAARGKYIEASFGKEWHSLLRYFYNYSGYNITAKTRINPDRIENNRNYFPHTDDAFAYATAFINAMRNKVIDDASGLTREQQWLQAFKASELSQQKLITEEQFLLKFGLRNDYTQTITNAGVVAQIDNVKYQYVLPDELYMHSVGRRINIVYNPLNMDTVLVTDGDKFRTLAYAPDFLPRARADYQPGDKERYWKYMAQKKRHMDAIANAKESRENITISAGINPAAYLQSGMVEAKEIKRAMELAMNEQQLINNTTPYNTENNGGSYEDLLSKM